jgi:hypothetical protein
MSFSFLLDEQLPKWWRRKLIRRQPHLSIWRVGQPPSPALGSPDPIVLEWCETHNAFLVTNNRKSMPGHLADHMTRGRHVPGIFVVDPAWDIAELAEELSLIEGASFPDEFRDQIQYLPLT